jgi:hypothetical protein
VLAAALGGCLGTSPDDRARAELGPAEDGDEEHRPGQPCLACHGEDYHPGEAVFAIAGTVYLTADTPDGDGLEGATVAVLDAAGREFTARTNRAGNFMVEVREGLGAPEQRDRGRLLIPWAPTFPVSVAVGRDGVEEDRAMETLIWREGSCAGCHLTDRAGTDHVEKVWFEEPAG